MTAKKTTSRLRRHSYGHDAAYKGHRDPAAEAKICDACESYKPLTSFRRRASREQGPNAFDDICKACVAAGQTDAILRQSSPDQVPLLPSAASIASLTDDECDEIFISLRWPDGIECPRCAHKRFWDLNHAKGLARKCRACGHRFSNTSGTPFASAKIPMRTILTMISIVQERAGVVVIRRVGLSLGLSYQTAYVLFGKAIEFLNGTDSSSTYRGFWHGSSNGARRRLGNHRRVCSTCKVERNGEDFALRGGRAGDWGMRTGVCNDCRRAQGKEAIVQSWNRRHAAYDEAAAEVIHRPVSELLQQQSTFMYWTHSRWTPQEKHDLQTLVQGNVSPERAAAVLARSESSIAWYARDLLPSLPPSWSKLITPRKLILPAQPRLHFPFVCLETSTTIDLLRVNDLVPHQFPEHMRADIAQSILLALYENEITIEDIERNKQKLSWFVKRWRQEQQPAAEIQVQGNDEDDRPYYEIAAQIRRETRVAEINESRLAKATYTDYQPATQVEEVYESEVRAAAWHLQRVGLSPKGARVALETGRLKAGNFKRPTFGLAPGVSRHALDRLQERFNGLELGPESQTAMLNFCRNRTPEDRDLKVELHVLLYAGRRVPIVYDRAEDVVKSILPENGGLGRGIVMADGMCEEKARLE
jgi:transposase-like protein